MPPVATWTTISRPLSLRGFSHHESSIPQLAWATTLFVYANEKNVQFRERFRGSVNALNILIDTEKTILEALIDIHSLAHSSCVDCAPAVNFSDWKSGSVLDLTVSEPSDGEETWTTDLDASAPLVLKCRLGENLTEISATGNAAAPSSWQMQRMVYQFRHLMDQFRSFPERKFASALTPSPEDHAFFNIRNGPAVPLTRVEACIHDMISAQVQAQPESEAICAWDITMSYQELETRAKLLSLQLIQAGAGPEVVVPVLFEKSGWTPVAMLAVLFSGAAFVLFDSSFPDERLKTMCKDTGATVGVCSAQCAGRSKSVGLKQVIVPNIIDPIFDPKDSTVPLPQASRPGNMAYIAFTSGSTGKPKGTVVEHAAFCTSAMAHGEAFRYTTTSRVLQFASYGFDASVAEILTTLIRGGCVCVPSEQDRLQDLAQATRRLNANSAFLTPAILRTLSPVDFPSLSKIICVGERVRLNDIKPWADGKILMNGYGPSECSVCSSVAQTLSSASDPANIGFPTGCRLWVVDRDDCTRLAPVGAVGELIVEGPIVGREYLNRPEQTAQVFFRDPPWIRSFRTSPWTFYRTGDLVHLEPDGSMRILGRKDHQVKLHGQRIELAEVEHAIHEAFPDCQRVIAAVVNRQSSVLVVFLLGMDGDIDNQESTSISSVFLKPSTAFQNACRVAVDTHLRQRLPQFMIPKLWFPLDQPPLTPNGKVDASRLSAEAAALLPEEAFKYTLSSGDRRTDVQNETEERIQRWVAQVLGAQQDQIALDASFFGQGGDSLTSMQTSALARKEGIELSPIALQEARSLAELAKQLDGENHHRSTQPEWLFTPQFIQDTDGLVKDALYREFSGISPTDIQYILPASELQDSFLNIPCEYFRLELRGPLDACQLQSAVQLLYQRHEILRTVVFRSHTDSRAYQVVLREFMPQLEVSESAKPLLQASDEWISTETRNEEKRKCPAWPAVRFFLARTCGHEHESCLVIRLKHTHYDAISITTLLNDLATLYQHGPESLPPALSYGQYQAFVASLSTSNTSEFWRDILHGSSPTQIGRQRALAPAPVVDASNDIPSVQPPLGITLATIVKTAWAISLAQQADQYDIVFQQVVNGRSQGPDGIQGVIGPCINVIPVRVSLAGEKCHQLAIEMLQDVQSQHVQSLSHETIGHSKLVDECTTWGSDAWIESLVLHQNMMSGDEYHLGQACGKVDVIYPEVETDEFILYSVPMGDRHQLRLAVPEGVLDHFTVNHLVVETCHWVLALAAHPGVPVSQLMSERKASGHSLPAAK